MSNRQFFVVGLAGVFATAILVSLLAAHQSRSVQRWAENNRQNESPVSQINRDSIATGSAAPKR